MTDKISPEHELDPAFEDFDTLEDVYEEEAYEEAQAEYETHVDDAEFEDVAAFDDADAFEDVHDANMAGAPKRKANWFNIAIAGVAVVLAGGLVLSKILPNVGSSQHNTMTMQDANNAGAVVDMQSSEASVQAALSPMATLGAQGGGMLDNPDAFSGLMESAAPVESVQPEKVVNDAEGEAFAALGGVGEWPEQGNVPMPSPIAPAEMEREEIVVSDVLPAVNAAPVQVEPVQDVWSNLEASQDVTQSVSTNEAMQNFMKAAEPEVVSTQSVDIVTAPVSATVDNTAVNAEVQALNARLSSLEGKVDRAIAQVERQANVQSAGLDNKQLDRIQNALERLESRIDDMAKSPRAANTTAVARVTQDAPKAAVQKASTPKTSAPVKRQEPVAKAAPRGNEGAYSAPKMQANSWKLRGAQPGLAIIAQADGNVREVRAGDFVPGVGQITGIASVSGKWVVQGTQGRISQ